MRQIKKISILGLVLCGSLLFGACGQAAAETSAAETTAAETTAAETTAAETTAAPETTAEETKAEPETAAAETAAPEDSFRIETDSVLDVTPEWLANIPETETASQLFVVAAYDTTCAWISMYNKTDDGKWEMIVSTPGFIGKKGLGKTKEGDSMTPVGTFGFNYAFGIADDPGCAIPYQKVTEDDYWSGDVRDGMKYNQMVSIKDYPDLNVEDSEHIVEYTRQYQYCMNISYNEACTPGLGSAIFLHCFGPYKPFTGGCVAIPENQMIKVMQNVKPDCVVVIDSLENLSSGFTEFP
ncbi:MAG: hypothetical protein IJ061_07010 [Lachnospiraceae bacterium]|nr:hypothetical protein [Lachnospiraceae bacterium]